MRCAATDERLVVTKNLKGKPLPPGPVTNEQALAAERRLEKEA